MPLFAGFGVELLDPPPQDAHSTRPTTRAPRGSRPWILALGRRPQASASKASQATTTPAQSTTGGMRCAGGVPGGTEEFAVMAMLNVAVTAFVPSRARRAEPYLRKALEIRRAQMAPNNWRVAELQEVLGESLLDQRRFAEAEKMLTAAYKTFSAQFPPATYAPPGR